MQIACESAVSMQDLAILICKLCVALQMHALASKFRAPWLGLSCLLAKSVENHFRSRLASYAVLKVMGCYVLGESWVWAKTMPEFWSYPKMPQWVRTCASTCI